MVRNRGDGQQVTYDRFWGFTLTLTCVMPLAAGEGHFLWQLLPGIEDGMVVAWVLLGSLTGIVALVLGLMGARGRWRHFTNFLLGSATLAVPILDSRVWDHFPFANPATLPLTGLATVGWVILVALGALYAGSGVRVVRPRQSLGQAMAGIGAFLLLVFVFLPPQAGEVSYAVSRLQLLGDLGAHWRTLVPFLLIGLAVVTGVVNFVRTPFEVGLAKLSRFLLVAGLMFWIALPFLESGAPLDSHLPFAWGSLRFLAPLFLAVDGTVAFMAISFSRS